MDADVKLMMVGSQPQQGGAHRWPFGEVEHFPGAGLEPRRHLPLPLAVGHFAEVDQPQFQRRRNDPLLRPVGGDDRMQAVVTADYLSDRPPQRLQVKFTPQVDQRSLGVGTELVPFQLMQDPHLLLSTAQRPSARWRLALRAREKTRRHHLLPGLGDRGHDGVEVGIGMGQGKEAVTPLPDVQPLFDQCRVEKFHGARPRRLVGEAEPEQGTELHHLRGDAGLVEGRVSRRASSSVRALSRSCRLGPHRFSSPSTARAAARASGCLANVPVKNVRTDSGERVPSNCQLPPSIALR